MKKKIFSILGMVLFLCLICNIVYAAETNVTLQKNKEKYTGGDLVEISVKVNDITLENGIETIIGKVNYNQELYESCEVEESNGWEADYNAANGKIILQRNAGIKENHTAFVIKLKIKENIVNNDTISFTDINIADEETDLFPQNAAISITIENVETDEEEPGEIPGEDPEDNPGETPAEKTLTSIEISEEPTKNKYEVGEKFDKTGMKVVAKYSDGSSKEITNYTIENGEELKEGQTSIKISYTEGNITKTVEQKITVVKKEIAEEEKKEDKKEDNKDVEKEKEDNTKAEGTIPYAGGASIIIIMVMLAVLGILYVIKYQKYKDI